LPIAIATYESIKPNSEAIIYAAEDPHHAGYQMAALLKDDLLSLKTAVADG